MSGVVRKALEWLERIGDTQDRLVDDSGGMERNGW